MIKDIQGLCDWLEAYPGLKGIVVRMHADDVIIVQNAMGKAVEPGVGTSSRVWLARQELDNIFHLSF